MARIRTIKPEFWTDEKLTECSLSARLLFIGLLNFADDNGNLQRSAKKIKMQIFPADAIDCEPLINELIAHGVLSDYSVNEELFLHIKGFKKHQVINRPSKSLIPPPQFTEDSLSAHGGLIDGREGKGKEEEKKESKYRFAGEIIRLSEKDYLEFQKSYSSIPDLNAELKAADSQYAKEPPGNWYCALGNRLNARHQQLLSKKLPAKPKVIRENVGVV